MIVKSYGSAVLTPGESAEYVCGDGTTGVITMPEDACGTQTFTVGCCSFEVRSSVGNWVSSSFGVYGGGSCGTCGTCGYTDYSEANYAGTKYSGTFRCFVQNDTCTIGEEAPGKGSCDACVECAESTATKVLVRFSSQIVEWEC